MKEKGRGPIYSLLSKAIGLSPSISQFPQIKKKSAAPLPRRSPRRSSGRHCLAVNAASYGPATSPCRCRRSTIWGKTTPLSDAAIRHPPGARSSSPVRSCICTVDYTAAASEPSLQLLRVAAQSDKEGRHRLCNSPYVHSRSFTATQRRRRHPRLRQTLLGPPRRPAPPPPLREASPFLQGGIRHRSSPLLPPVLSRRLSAVADISGGGKCCSVRLADQRRRRRC